jgi:hypothetical protein
LKVSLAKKTTELSPLDNWKWSEAVGNTRQLTIRLVAVLTGKEEKAGGTKRK